MCKVDRLEVPGCNEPPADVERIEQLMSNNLSESQLDLVLHGDGDPFAPGHVKPHQYDSKTRQRNKEYSEMFLDSEKNGLSKRNILKTSPIEFNIQDFNENKKRTETSSL